MTKQKRFWVSWFSDAPLDEFELHSPWWISGYEMSNVEGKDDVPTICAAILAHNEQDAKNIVRYAYDKPPERIRWRFVNARADDWEPFVDRFPRADWMVWPSPSTSKSDHLLGQGK